MQSRVKWFFAGDVICAVNRLPDCNSNFYGCGFIRDVTFSGFHAGSAATAIATLYASTTNNETARII
jgi:hypothetical protein